MSPITSIESRRPAIDPLRATRARYVAECLEDERWSIRQAAIRIGLSHTSLSARLSGATAFQVEDIESIAVLLKRNPVEFFAAYIAGGSEKAPTPEGEGRTLPGLDSNQEPIGFKPGPGADNVIRGNFGRPQRDVTPHPIAAIGGTR